MEERCEDGRALQDYGINNDMITQVASSGNASAP